MPDEKQAAAVDEQRRHWEATFEARPEMFGRGPSDAAIRSAAAFRAADVHRILELGGGQGRDALFFAQSGFDVHVVDYAQSAVDAVLRQSTEAGLGGRVVASQHDVRLPLPFGDASFDACYSHMLFCMALTTAELEALSGEILRVLKPGGVCVYTVRNTSDADYRRGLHRGEDMYENQGFIVHFFDRSKVERLAHGFELVSVEDFEEGKLPRRLYRVTLRKPESAGRPGPRR